MRINDNFFKVLNIYTKNSKVIKSDKIGKTVDNKDVVTLSGQAKDYQLALKAVRQCPDIRTEKIKEIEQKYANGIYNTSGEDIANKLVNKYLDKKA